MTWGLDYMGPIKPPTRYIGNHNIIVAMDYITKWVEVKVLQDNTTRSTTKFFMKIFLHVLVVLPT